jgi:hypothetical protein
MSENNLCPHCSMMNQKTYTKWEIDCHNNLLAYNKYGDVICCLSMWEVLAALGYKEG